MMNTGCVTTTVRWAVGYPRVLTHDSDRHGIGSYVVVGKSL